MAEKKQNNIKYPIAKNHQLIQVLPQFRPIKRGARKRGVERIYTSKDGKTKAIIMMWKELDVADQDLLLSILAIALPIERGNILDETSSTVKKLYEQLELKGLLAKWQTLYIETTLDELRRELNRSDGAKTYKFIRESLKRLMNTSIEIETEETIYGTNLIGYEIDKNTRQIKIALNPINALVFLNDKNGYILHNRKERFALRNETAKALHSILVELVAPNQNRVLKIDTLIEKVYLDNMDTQQKRNARRAIKTALQKIAQLERWDIEMYNNGTVKVKRI